QSDDVRQSRPPGLAPIADPAQPARGTRLDGAPRRAGSGPGGRQHDRLQGRAWPPAAAGLARRPARPKLVCPAATQLGERKSEPSERDNDRHRKGADRKALLAAGSATRRAWRRLKDIGQEERRGGRPRAIEKGRPALTATAPADEQGDRED